MEKRKLFTTLKEICYKLGLIADYVVEIGTSNDWTYRKWKSGIAECWGDHNEKGDIATTTLGPYQYRIFLDLPLDLFTSVEMVNGWGHTGTGIGWISYISCTAKHLTVYVGGNQQDASCSAYLYVIGTWGG